jgi:hypothetical protein
MMNNQIINVESTHGLNEIAIGKTIQSVRMRWSAQKPTLDTLVKNYNSLCKSKEG